MNDEMTFSAQVVMKRADGRSILDPEPPARAGPADCDLPDERVREIRSRLTALGFRVAAGNSNTLSVIAPVTLYRSVFGLDTDAVAAGGAAHAASIRPDLRPFVADVFVTPGPTFFP